ncbi:MAG TPA: hypothetical protein VEM35_05175, partial [Rhizomicrobium sp.]|nr:hypothetical protein [Rhizomicrobium sp.]
MRVLILNGDYPGFLVEQYIGNPGLSKSSYAEQLAARNASLFGVADFYSRNFIANGHEAAEIHVNNPWLQYAWARENGLRISAPRSPRTFAARHVIAIPKPSARAEEGAPVAARPQHPAPQEDAEFIDRVRTFVRPVLKPVLKPFSRPIQWLRRRLKKKWEMKILRAQNEAFRPDLILNQEMAYFASSDFDDLKKPGCLLFGQIASALPKRDGFENYDLVISSLPNQVAWFRGHGSKAEVNRLAFDPVVLERMGPAPSRDIPLSFVGSLSPDHVKRIQFLEYLAVR